MCQQCLQDEVTLNEILVEVLKLMTFTATVTDAVRHQGDVESRQQRIRETSKRWLEEIRSEGPMYAQQVAVKLLQKHAEWTSKELAGVTLAPNHN